MKFFVLFLASFPLILMVACGSDEGGNSINSDQQSNATADPADVNINPGYHDAIDLSPAANPAEREQAYLQVAAELANPFIPKPNQDLVFKLRWEEAIDGNASILITGLFQEGERWVERQADFRITRTAEGSWILKDEVTFGKTEGQLSIEYQEQKEIEDEIQRQEDLAELNRIKEAFDSITVKFIETEYVPDDSGYPGVDGFIFHLGLTNPTQYSRSVTYNIEWRETRSDAVGEQCWRDYEYIGEFDQSSSEEISPQSEIPIEEQPYTSIAYTTRFCDDLTVEILDLLIVKIDGYTPEKLAQELSALQTSP